MTFLAAAVMAVTGARAQRTLTLQECRDMATQADRELQQEKTKVEMAGYDRKIALANYFPNISGTGAYLYNPNDIALISEAGSEALRNAGTTLHGVSSEYQKKVLGDITEYIQKLAATDPASAMKYMQLMQDPLLQTLLGSLSSTDFSAAVNAIGQDIDDALHPDLENILVGSVTVQQPIFMGGKIVAANRIAKLAEELSQASYDQRYRQTIVDVDQAYWQIVSIAAKKRLAESYSDLLRQMEKDVDLAVKEGVSTESDALQIKVKANEADMLKTRSVNGLAMAKMLLCKRIGLPLDTEITLADEALERVPVARTDSRKSLEEIYADRPETRSLELASRIYDNKVAVARADMLPKVAAMGGYMVSNPNLKNGFEKSWNGYWGVGVVVNVPIFHGFEALNKTRKAKAEASLYRSKLEDAKELINLQVTQLRKQEEETLEKLSMAESDLESAEENLRVATVGFNEGVITANTALGAQTAWLKAHSEFIDAGIELQMLASNLEMAEGNNRPVR
ncbi:MAG: TolC family protein [Bacteroidales bacterium]|nr:TolC family protein [Bacteroidales bacterium]